MERIQPGLYDVMRQRTYFYMLMSDFYSSAPSEDFLKNFDIQAYKEKTEDLPEEGYDELSEGISMLLNFFESDQSLEPSTLEEKYNEIFDEDFIPRESIQNGMEGREKDVLLEELEERYTEFGWDRKTPEDEWHLDDIVELEPDHLAVQAAYMTYLCVEIRSDIVERNAERVSELLYEQADLYNSHLTHWVPEFAEKLYEKDPEGFYGAVAKLTSGYMNIDGEILPLLSDREKKLEKIKKSKDK